MGFCFKSSAVKPPPDSAVPLRLRRQAQTGTLEKSRLEFFSATRFRAGVFAAQPLETHREKRPTPTKTVSGISFWLSRDPIGEEAFANYYLSGKPIQVRKWLKEQALLPSYLFVRNAPFSTYDIDGAVLPSPVNYPGPDWRSVWRDRYVELRRLPNGYGPQRACETVNAELGASVPCSSLGWKPEPDLYCGCKTEQIEAAAQWLRHHADEVPAIAGGQGTSIGADKLAHCYAFCVAAYWYYVPVAFHWYTGVSNDDANDVAANEAGFSLGRGKVPFGNPCSCLKDCAAATYNMPFE